MADARLFVVIRTRGAGWDASRPLELQDDWKGHAAFMNALAKSGFVVLGGPLEGSADALLVIRAGTSEEISARLAADPWASTDLLRVSWIAPWQLRLGSLP
jgi:hypothetical protein